ncbi:MAG TPA: TRCF domain-containing protein, partial [Chthoniobacteraceae bacterium]|nr:TRCF domain-containing protein [Chthoniobacteraceae bacterium]
MKGEKVRARLEATLRFDFIALREAEFAVDPDGKAPAFIPVSYIAESQPRIQAYRRLNEINTQEQLDALRKTWRDRFGRMPDSAENLLLLTELKISAAARKIASIEVREDRAMLKRIREYVQIGGKFPRVHAEDPGERLREVLKLVRAF